jgi:Rieske Fe-S protein
MEAAENTTSLRAITRRRVSGLAVAGVAAPVLAACGSDGSTGSPTTTATSAAPSETPTAAPSTTPAEAPGGLVSTSDVPVGGGVILADEKLVVTQPTAGEFKAFSAVCTHQGCVVSGITETIDCACHGSKYSLSDGSVVGGPAPAPLPAETIVVDGGAVTRG